MTYKVVNAFSMSRRGLLIGAIALAACDTDNTPIIAADDGDALQYAGGPGIAGAGGDASGSYRLNPGDKMRIIVYGQNHLTGDYSLDNAGMLSFPLAGQIRAAGMTPGELERTIKSKLDPDYIRGASVSVEVASKRPFYIIGEIRNPGSYPYVSGISVFNAVALAGGYTYRARENSFYIKRTDKNGQIVRVVADSNTVIRPGDTILVRERYF
ncbi:MAG: polysaccharide export protein [Alphaproteobacteria bacterium]|nr:polysaccharide export protein [Alphaproteobacteria bacterium]MCW5738692.1 polysaccharide export protein [Alphaproteobacteria bacterium]